MFQVWVNGGSIEEDDEVRCLILYKDLDKYITVYKKGVVIKGKPLKPIENLTILNEEESYNYLIVLLYEICRKFNKSLEDLEKELKVILNMKKMWGREILSEFGVDCGFGEAWLLLLIIKSINNIPEYKIYEDKLRLLLEV